MSLKNPVTPSGIDPGTVRIVAQRLNHYATPGPVKQFNNHSKITLYSLCLSHFFTNVSENGDSYIKIQAESSSVCSTAKNSFKYSQQDVMLYSILYYCQCSTCFRRFLRHHQELKNCTHSIGYMPSMAYTRCCVYSF